MKLVFASIEKGDTLYIVYNDLNDNYQIGEAKVIGFYNWTYTVGDRWEDWGERPQTNILYEFEGVKFSRNLEYSMNKTHFTDSPEYNSKYNHIFSDRFVETFTTYDEAKEFSISKLLSFINIKSEQIDNLNKEIEKYQYNLIKIKAK